MNYLTNYVVLFLSLLYDLFTAMGKKERRQLRALIARMRELNQLIWKYRVAGRWVVKGGTLKLILDRPLHRVPPQNKWTAMPKPRSLPPKKANKKKDE